MVVNMGKFEDITQERIEGPTPHNGVYAIAYFMDNTGTPTSKDKAEKVEIHEVDKNGEVIYRTYGVINAPEEHSRHE